MVLRPVLTGMNALLRIRVQMAYESFHFDDKEAEGKKTKPVEASLT